MINMFLSAYKVTEVTDMITYLYENRRPSWKPVGDRENNLATINLGSDPAAGLIERITNAIDGVLERKWEENNQPTNVSSPRQAVAQWYGIQDGLLENVNNIRNVADVAHQVAITLFDSGNPERPTVDVRDFGIGIKAEDFSSTILSLNGSRKLRKFFLSGAFGQGGSTALSYSHYTIILSRAFSKTSHTINPVAATIVRFNPGDTSIDKHGLYEYLVDNATGQPYIFDVPESEFPTGTLVRHVSMDLGKYKSIMTAPTGSLWYLTHHYLFDPVLPFWIEEQRHNTSEGEGRTIAGSRRRLCTSPEVEYQRTATLIFRFGSVKVAWWVFTAEGDRSKDFIKNFCLPSRPIVITYNGQKQGDLPNTIIKNDLKLPYLDRYIIVHIDCDNLDNESRRQLFPTTRESLRDTSLLEDLRLLVVETLGGDDELKRLDKERKQRFMQRTEGQAVENIRKRLAKRVQAFMKSGNYGEQTRRPQGGSGSGHQEKPPIPVQDPPTLLEITSPGPRKVFCGSNFYLHFRTYANPDLFRDPDAFIAVINPPSFGQYSGTTNIKNGYGVAYFSTKENLDPGTISDITLELRPRRSRAISSSIQAEVIPRPSDSGGSGSQNTLPNINPQWVSTGDHFWNDHDWDESSVAEVVETDDDIHIYVSAENKKLNTLLQRAQRRGVNEVEAVKDFYLEHISFYAYLSFRNKQQFYINHELTDASGQEDNMSEKIQRMEMETACETVVGIMLQMFDFLLTNYAAVSIDNNE